MQNERKTRTGPAVQALHEVMTPTLRLGPFKTGFSLLLKSLFFVIIKTITKSSELRK